MIRQLIIDSMAIALETAGEVDQSYELAYDGTELPMMDGSTRKLYLGPRKLKTTISARGHVPSELAAIDTAVPHQIHCLAWRSVSSATPEITAPGSYRTDFPPVGQAVVDGRIVLTPWADGEATAVAGASRYRLLYLPILTCWVTLTESGEPYAARYAWSLTGREA